MSGPLHGVKVVELGVWVAGPAAAGVLGDWGADVIKIEPLSGDPARTFQRMFGGDMPNNPVFELDNRNKRGIALDISTPEGREIALELLDQADVFVTNVRVDALKRAGLDYDTVSARNPRLVYGQITGYGLEGQMRIARATTSQHFGRAQESPTCSLPKAEPCPFSAAVWAITPRESHLLEQYRRRCINANVRVLVKWCRRRCCDKVCTRSVSIST